jgi:hypothetical protein
MAGNRDLNYVELGLFGWTRPHAELDVVASDEPVDEIAEIRRVQCSDTCIVDPYAKAVVGHPDRDYPAFGVSHGDRLLDELEPVLWIVWIVLLLVFVSRDFIRGH